MYVEKYIFFYLQYLLLILSSYVVSLMNFDPLFTSLNIVGAPVFAAKFPEVQVTDTITNKVHMHI